MSIHQHFGKLYHWSGYIKRLFSIKNPHNCSLRCFQGTGIVTLLIILHKSNYPVVILSWYQFDTSFSRIWKRFFSSGSFACCAYLPYFSMQLFSYVCKSSIVVRSFSFNIIVYASSLWFCNTMTVSAVMGNIIPGLMIKFYRLISEKILYIFSQNHLDQVFIQHDRAVPGIKDHTFDSLCSKCGFK